MKRLVADVGGTNTRVGLAENGKLRDDSVQSFRNDDFTTFTQVVDHYLAQHDAVRVSEIAVAVAGPVQGTSARLTNRNWSFDAGTLSKHLNGAKAGLMNDLNALGYALPFLPATSLAPVIGDTSGQSADGQSLVIGIGTGFNVSPVVHMGLHVHCPTAEFGHVHLPLDIYQQLRARIGDKADAFSTVEHVFSGRGFVAVYCAVTGRDATLAEEIIAQGQQTSDPGFDDFMNLYAELLAALTRNLLLAFLPSVGVCFAGGLARAVLSSAAVQRFADSYNAPMTLADNLHAPVCYIQDDAAALKGCAKFPIPERNTP